MPVIILLAFISIPPAPNLMSKKICSLLKFSQICHKITSLSLCTPVMLGNIQPRNVEVHLEHSVKDWVRSATDKIF